MLDSLRRGLIHLHANRYRCVAANRAGLADGFEFVLNVAPGQQDERAGGGLSLLSLPRDGPAATLLGGASFSRNHAGGDPSSQSQVGGPAPDADTRARDQQANGSSSTDANGASDHLGGGGGGKSHRVATADHRHNHHSQRESSLLTASLLGGAAVTSQQHSS